MKCQVCSVETYMPFKCAYCNQYFCQEHRLPENHSCPEEWRTKVPRGPPLQASESDGETSYQYTVSWKPRKRVVWFSNTEVKHLLIGALLTLAIGFSIPLYSLYLGVSSFWSPPFLLALALIFMVSFIIHELAHKIVAQYHGLWAEFRITMFGALVTLISVVSPFKIVSPGAVVIGGVADKKTIGETSIAGPLTNIALALFLLACYQLVGFPRVLEFGVMLNSFIALFNLIPFGLLDGFKILSWNKGVWVTAFAVSLVLTIYSYLSF